MSNDVQKVDIVFKKVMFDSSATSTDRKFFEEPITNKILIFDDQIIAGTVPSTSPAGPPRTGTAGVYGDLTLFKNLVLVPINGSPDAFYHNDLKDTIPFNYDPNGSYLYHLTTNAGVDIPFGQGDWIVDNAAGTLVFYSGVPAGVSAGTPPKISIYKYTSTKGVAGGLTANLAAIDAVTPLNGQLLVGDGTTWVGESGATARTSIGLGTTDNVTFAGVTADNLNLNADTITNTANALTLTTVSNNNINLTPNGTGIVNIATSLQVANMDLASNTITATNTNGSLSLVPNGTGSVNVTGPMNVDNFSISANTISATNVNGSINLVPNGTGSVVAPILQVDNIQINGDAITNTAGNALLITTTTNSDINLTPNGTGKVNINGTSLQVDNMNLAGNTITATGDLNLSPSGEVLLSIGANPSTNAAITAGYVTSQLSNIDVKSSVRLATTGALANSAAGYNNGTNGVGATITGQVNGVITDGTGSGLIDSVTVVVGDRILVKNQATPAHNGIYVVTDLGSGTTPYIVTRTTDFDEPSDMPGANFFIEEGGVFADRGFVCTTNAAGLVVGSTAITFSKFSGAGQITAGNGISITNDTINAVGTANKIDVSGGTIDISATYAGQTSITTVGTITSGTWTGATIAVANGGTGGTTTATARTNLDVVQRPPTTATDRAIFVSEVGSTGNQIAGTGITISALDIMSNIAQLNVDNIRLDGDTISNVVNALTITTVSNNNINLTPNGTGKVIIDNTALKVDNINITGNTISTLASDLILSPVNAVNITTSLNVDNITLDLNTISTVSGNLTLAPIGSVDVSTNLNVGNMNLANNTIAATGALTMTTTNNNNINLNPNGTGAVSVSTSLVTPTIQTNTITATANLTLAPTGEVRVPDITSASNDLAAATKKYVDTIATGLDPKNSVRVATTTPLPAYTYNNGVSGVGATITATANGALTTIDGITLIAGNRLLVKDETGANEPYNGVYDVTDAGSGTTPFVLTRSIDFDEANEVASAFFFVEEGNTNDNTGWVCTTNEPVNIGTTPILFAQFSGAGQIVAGAGLSKNGNTLDVIIDSRVAGTATTEIINDEVRVASAWAGQTSLTTLGTITTGAWNGTAIAIAYGGTGANNAADARLNLDVIQRPASTAANRLLTSVDTAGSRLQDTGVSIVSQSITGATSLVTGTTTYSNGSIDNTGGAITIQSATNSNIVLTAQGSGVVGVDNITLSGDTVHSTTLTLTSTNDINLNPGALNTVVVGTDLDVGALNFNNNVISSTTANTDINLTPNGTGTVLVGTSLTVDNLLLDADTISNTAGPLTLQTASNNNIVLNPNGTGSVNIGTDLNVDSININANTISTTAIDTNLNLSPNGTGTVVISTDLDVGGLNVNNNVISSTGANANISLLPNGTGEVLLKADPVSALGAATRQFVLSNITASAVKSPARVATTTALPASTYNNGISGVGATLTANANGALVAQDSITLTANDVILVKDEANPVYNGLYVVTDAGNAGAPWILTRTTDFDNGDEIPASIITVSEGTTYANQSFICTSNATVVVGTSSIVFAKTSGTGQIVAGNGLTKNDQTNTIDIVGTLNRIDVFSNNIDIASTYVGQTSITTIGTIGTGVWQGTAVGVAYGGTGATTAAGARTNLDVVQRPASAITDGNLMVAAAGGNQLAGTGIAVAGDAMTGLTALTVDNITLNGNTISAVGALTISPAVTFGADITVGTFNITNSNINSTGAVTITTAANNDINLTPNGTGVVNISALSTANLSFTPNTITATNTNGSINLVANGTGTVVIDGTALDVDNLTLAGNSLTATNTNGNVNVTANGTGSVVVGPSLQVGNVSVSGNDITATGAINLTPSTAVNINGTALNVDNLNIAGNTITATNTNGSINLTANGTGTVIASALDVDAISINNNTISTTSGNLILAPVGSVDMTTANIGNFNLSGNTFSSTNTNGNIVVTPNGTGIVDITSSAQISNLSISDNIINNVGAMTIGTSANGNLTLAPNGTGIVNVTSDLTATSLTSDTINSTNLSINATTVSTTATVNISDITLNGGTISTTNTNGSLTLAPNGTGEVLVPSVTLASNANAAATVGLVSDIFSVSSNKNAARASTTADLGATYNNGSAGVGATLTGGLQAFTTDGVTFTAADVNVSRVLVKDQTSGPENGVYLLTTLGSATTNWVLTRVVDMDEPADFPSAVIAVQEGNTYADEQFICITNNDPNNPIVIGTNTITFNRIASGLTAGNGININNTTDVISAVGTTNRIDVSGGTIDIASTYVGQTSIITVGTITTGVWNGTAVGTAYGGTGATTVAGARTNLDVVQRPVSAITDGNLMVAAAGGNQLAGTGISVTGDAITNVTSLTVDTITLNADTISSTGNLILAPTGSVVTSVISNTGSIALNPTTSVVIDGTALDVDNLTLAGNTVSSTNVNGNINVTANGTGSVIVGPSLQVGNVTVSGNDITATGAINLTPSTAVNINGTVLNVDNLSFANNTISTTNANGSLTIAPNGTGELLIPAISGTSSDLAAATKIYVDNIASGLDPKPSSRLSTTAVLTDTPVYNNGTSGVGATLTGATTGAVSDGTGVGQIDGVTVVAGDRILVKDQANAAHNGIYVVTVLGNGTTAYVLTRATDMDESTEIVSAFTFIEEGTTNADSGWVCTTDAPVTMGTTLITFAQFSGAGQIIAGNGLAKTGNTLDVTVDSRTAGTATTEIVNDEVRIASAWIGQTSLTTLGTITTGSWQGTAIGTAYGGTGATTVANARTNLDVVQRPASAITDGNLMVAAAGGNQLAGTGISVAGDALTGLTALTVDTITLNGSTISSTGNLTFAPTNNVIIPTLDVTNVISSTSINLTPTSAVNINGTALNVDNLNIAGNTITATGNIILAPSGSVVTSNISTATGDLTLAPAGTLLIPAVTETSADLTSATTALAKSFEGYRVLTAVVAKTVTALPSYTQAGAGVGATLTANANAAFPTIDGITVALNDRVLVDDSGSIAGADNGVYTLTATGSGAAPWVLTRATDNDSVVEVQPGTFVRVSGGDTYGNTGWQITSQVNTVDTDVMTWDKTVGQAASGNAIGTPSDGIFGPSPDGGPSGLLPTDTTADGFDKVDTILALLAPAKPQPLSAVTIALDDTLYSAYAADGTVAPSLLTSVENNASNAPSISNIGSALSVPGFGDASTGNLIAQADTGAGLSAVGTIALTTGDDTGTNGSLVIVSDDDHYAGIQGKAGFYTSIIANINTNAVTTFTPSSGSQYSMRLTHSVSGNTNTVSFYQDNAHTLGTPSISANPTISNPVTTSVVSGVNVLSTGDTFDVSYVTNNVVGLFFHQTWIAQVSAGEITDVAFNPVSAGVAITAGVSPSRVETVTVVAGQFNASTICGVVCRQSDGTTSANVNTTTANVRVDSASLAATTGTFINEGNTGDIRRRVSGVGQFPAWVDTAFNASTLLTTNEELQLEGGAYKYPPAVNYTTHIPAGPDYSTIAAGSYANMRWVTIRFAGVYAVTDASSVTLTFANTANFGTSVIVANFALYVRVDGASSTNGWIDGNAAYSGVGNPTNDGDAALDYSSSSATVKRITFGNQTRTGNVIVRVGIPAGDNKTFTGITIA